MNRCRSIHRKWQFARPLSLAPSLFTVAHSVAACPPRVATWSVFLLALCSHETNTNRKMERNGSPRSSDRLSLSPTLSALFRTAIHCVHFQIQGYPTSCWRICLPSRYQGSSRLAITFSTNKVRFLFVTTLKENSCGNPVFRSDDSTRSHPRFGHGFVAVAAFSPEKEGFVVNYGDNI